MRTILLKFIILSCAATYSFANNSQTPKEYKLSFKEISKDAFLSLKQRVNPTKHNFEKITDIKKVQQLLKGIVYWGQQDENGDIVDEEEFVKEFIFRNGNKLEINEHMVFIAYYPDEDIILFDGVHSSDMSYNLKTGETTKEVGNPEYIVFSPSKKYRFNGSYGGQECFDFFIQQKNNNKYKKIIDLAFEFEEVTGVWLCTIKDAFWSDDNTLYIITSKPINDGRDTQMLYYQITLL